MSKAFHKHKGLIVTAFACTLVLGAACAGCAPKTAAPADNGGNDAAAQEEVSITWSPTMDCAVCHETQNATMTDGVHDASVHLTESPEITCVSCHTDEAGLSKAHEGKSATDTMPKELKKTKIDPAGCQASGCHDLSSDEMLALTADYTALVDSKGTMVNPHDVLNKTEGHSELDCSSCHSMHGEEIAAEVTCVSCHHSGVYECNTCHEV